MQLPAPPAVTVYRRGRDRLHSPDRSSLLGLIDGHQVLTALCGELLNALCSGASDRLCDDGWNTGISTFGES